MGRAPGQGSGEAKPLKAETVLAIFAEFLLKYFVFLNIFYYVYMLHLVYALHASKRYVAVINITIASIIVNFNSISRCG